MKMAGMAPFFVRSLALGTVCEMSRYSLHYLVYRRLHMVWYDQGSTTYSLALLVTGLADKLRVQSA